MYPDYLWLVVWLSDKALVMISSYSTPDPVSTWLGDRLRIGKLLWYVTGRRGQLSLAIPPWVGAMSTSLGWEGNHRSGVAQVMRRRQWFVYPPTGSTAYVRKMSTPPTLLGHGTPLP